MTASGLFVNIISAISAAWPRGDATNLMLALGTAGQGGAIDRVPGRTQTAGYAPPDPAALIGAVDQNESRHVF
jgi:hypothetical protein